MEGRFPVYFGEEIVGSVDVRPEGLYHVFCCCCQLSGDVMLDLCLHIGSEVKKLGLLCPVTGGFGLRKRLSGLPEGASFRFTLQPRRTVGKGLFCPVRETEPFTYLHCLQKAFLARENGQIGLLLQEEK